MSTRRKSNTSAQMPEVPAWVGIPNHQGVIHVGGRVGAAKGPQVFRRVLGRMKEAVLRDLGDVSGFGFSALENVRKAKTALMEMGTGFSPLVVVGGSNEFAYSQVAALSEKTARVGCINVDAHFDLRPYQPHMTSGSPFRLALDEGVLDPGRFVEFGIQAHCNAPELWEYARSKKISVQKWESLRVGKALAGFKRALTALATKSELIAVCIDLDAAAEAFAPGVSAPQAEGFTAEEMISLSEIAGAHPKVASFGIYELNPEHDSGERTARLAATMAWHFARARPQK